MAELEIFDSCWLIEPIPYEVEKEVRLFIPRSGPANRQTRIDQAARRKISIDGSVLNQDDRQEVIRFWNDHFPDKNFIFHDKLLDRQFEAWISSNLKIPTGLASSDFAFVIEEVNPMPTDFEAPTTPTNLTLSTTAGQLKATWGASTDDSGTIAEYEVTIEPPEVIA